MDSLILPVLTDMHTIDEALDRMAATDRRAVVVQHSPGDYVLYMNRLVANAWEAGKSSCASLRDFGGEAVPVLDRFATPDKLGSLAELIERQLDELNSLLGVVFPPRPDDDIMVIVTRHEQKRDEVVTAGLVCGCAGTFRHTAPSPPAAKGGSCVVCGEPYTCW